MVRFRASALVGTLLCVWWGVGIGAAPGGPSDPRSSGPRQMDPGQPTAGSSIGFVDMRAVASGSSLGKALAAQLDELRKRKNEELSGKREALQAAQQKLQQPTSVISDAARLQLQRDVDRMTREWQFLTRNAQADIDDLQQALSRKFQVAVDPVLADVAATRQIHAVFNLTQAGVLWADPALDLTKDVIAALDKRSASQGR